jgi:hypothetical protein
VIAAAIVSGITTTAGEPECFRFIVRTPELLAGRSLISRTVFSLTQSKTAIGIFCQSRWSSANSGTAYKKLTDACNSCHEATNVGVNVIVVPDASTFPNQDFRRAKP